MSRKEVIEKTLGEIRSFLDEFSNGTSRYRGLHNLTEQVEHQYHGRFLIELIQNAHDALFEVGVIDPPQRIDIILERDEYPYGALYIANDGQPFTPSNFNALSNLGQSDKDPQKSIGNKGIGFRSVLEITKAPEIYSRKKRESPSFDGYCFGFQPDVIEIFKEPIRRIVDGDNSVESPEAIGGPLLEWDDTRYEAFREKCRHLPQDWLRDELDFLSPYALPIPMDTQEATPRVKDFERRGFSTVIRLPFIDDRTRKIAKNKLGELSESTAIFLHRVNVLRLRSASYDRTYNREQILRDDDPEGGDEIQITTDESETKQENGNCIRYWLWKRTIGGENNTCEKNEIQLAVADLPGKWPEVDEATVEIAVQLGNTPVDGVINIYLPTKTPSGCGAHFSAPFFGDMSRTDVDFKNSLNSLLLRKIAEKGVDIIFNSLSGKGDAEAAAIIDLLAPTDNDYGKRWWDAIGAVFSDREKEIERENIFLSDEGWNSLVYTRLLPTLQSDVVIKYELLRSEATYPIFVQSLREREAAIRRIFDEVDIVPEAMADDYAATIEAIARKLHESQESVDWTGFWKDVESLFPNDTKPLIGKNILLGTDNQLHSSGDRCTVFFRPRSSGSDDDELSEDQIEDIPESLRPFIAFLNESIQTHIPRERGGSETTAVHRYLSKDLVVSYRAASIFSDVLVNATPKLPHEIDGPYSQLCQDIFQWGLRLLKASNYSADDPIRIIGELPVPCIGGWYPMNKTSFGTGWPGKSGTALETYLRFYSTPESSDAINCLLLPPDHSLWGELGLSSVDYLEKGGVFDGIRLVSVTERDWNTKFVKDYGEEVKLPLKGPAGYGIDLWDSYREHIRCTKRSLYKKESKYEVKDLYALPAFEKLEKCDSEFHNILMELLLVSIPSWQKRWESWKKVSIRKIEGAWDTISSVSPLAYSLIEMKWLQEKTDEEIILFRPKDRWHIPSHTSMGGLHLFSHLMPMPYSVASLLSRNSELVLSMQELGMPSYDLEKETADPRLLNDLAAALQDPKIDISNINVFLGQIRDAWSQFNPNEDSVFPESVIVQNGSGSLKSLTPTDEETIYLPDASYIIHKGLDLHSKSVITMYPKDAKRLQVLFQNAYGSSVRLASELETKAIVNGIEWQAEENGPQLSEELPWLIPVVLTILAFSGGQNLGIGTKKFTKAIDSLRRARIVWVDSLEAELWHGGLLVGKTPVPAIWLLQDDTLLAISDAQIELSQLSEALASIVGRYDIDIPLKVVLGDYQYPDHISEDLVCTSLRKIYISADHYQEVQQRWLGDLAWMVRLVRPLILLLQPDANIAILDEVYSEEEFRDALQTYSLGPLDIDDVMSIVRDSVELKIMGRKVWEILGHRAQLDQWNKALSLSDESLVTNDHADMQFQEHVDSIRTLMHSIIRHTIRCHPESKGFKDLEEDLSTIKCPKEYIEKYWVVEFPEVMKKICDILSKWNSDPNVITLVENAKNIEALRYQIDKLGLEPDIDPIEIHADNYKIFFRVLEDVRKLMLAWCAREDNYVGIWEHENAIFEGLLKDDFEKTAFVDKWNEEKCLSLIGKLSYFETHERLRSTLDICTTVSELMNKLGITDVDIKKAHFRFEKQKQDQELQKKTVRVCGKDFVNSEDNLNNLWDHIHRYIEDCSVGTVDLSDIEELREQATSKRRKTGNNKPRNSRRSNGRMNQDMKNLVGLAGEIHAFRRLQNSYGIETVGPRSWISDNSRHKFPENTTDDGFGCDFVIRNNGKTHYVEVKATKTENQVFELGTSEVELAIDSANLAKKEFVILHVLDALSDSPQFRLLPNPYDNKYRSKYKYQGAGLRLQYDTK